VHRYRNLALFVVLGLIWGAAYPAIKAGLDAVPPVLFAAVRYDVAGVLMLGYVAATRDYRRPQTRADWTNVAIGGVLIIAAYNAFLFVGETAIPSAVAAILVATVPLFTSLFARTLLPSDGLDVPGVAGVLLGFLGILVISRPDPTNLLATDVVGQLFVLVAALSMAFGSTLTQRYDAAQPVLTMEAWSMALGAVLLHVVAFARPTPSLLAVEWTTHAVWMVLYLAIFSSAVAYFLYFHLLEQLGPFEMNFIAYAAAAFGALTGWLFLGERITVYTVAGYALILAGFVLLKREQIRGAVSQSETSYRAD
jgi:probable blue pigment (indigoidine) exporter